MVRKKHNKNSGIATMQRVNDVLSRTALASRMGYAYGDDRKVYEALGYPTEKELTFDYYYKKYERQDIAAAIIDRPVEATWDGEVMIVEEGEVPADSELSKAWIELEKQFKIKHRLVKVDKLTGIGQFGILLFGFEDVKKPEDFKTPVTGKRKLLYLKQLSEASVSVEKWETNSSKERYGLPLTYKLKVGGVGDNDPTKDIVVHHSRILHIVHNNLVSEVYGRPRLKPIINRLADLEKLLGGDAEMFWRGARPGYHVAAQPDYEMGDPELEALETELDKYEHDLRRFISAKGVDIKALEQQVADPTGHIDTQLQAISAQTGIPKRVLIGSERGELASSQDKDAWLTLIQSRMTEFAEPQILKPFIDKCMKHGILPEVEDYVVIWQDIFAPSEKQKVEVGELRSKALKVYADSPFASELLPPQLAHKYLLGLSDDQSAEILQLAIDEAAIEDVTIIEEEEEETP